MIRTEPLGPLPAAPQNANMREQRHRDTHENETKSKQPQPRDSGTHHASPTNRIDEYV